MDEIIAILILLALFILVMPVIALVKASTAARDAREALERVHALESLRDVQAAAAPPAPAASKPPREPSIANQEPTPPPLPPEPEIAPEIPIHSVHAPRPKPATIPAPSSTAPPAPPASSAPVPEGPAFSFEQFLGVKLFAWLGGLAIFFGVVFFIKYAFDRDLIPPAVRIAIGFATGTGLLVGGLLTHRKETLKVLAQSLCATGILTLYGSGFAAHAVYQFPAFGPAMTFAVMCAVTVAALVLSLRLNAAVIAALGMLGGFLTPVLLPVSLEHPIALFSYIVLLDAGILFLTRSKPWFLLAPAAALGTLVIQALWLGTFLFDRHAFDQPLLPMGIFLLFSLLFPAITRRHNDSQSPPGASDVAIILPLLSALGFAALLLAYPAVAGRPLLLFGYVGLLNLVSLAAVWRHPKLAGFHGLFAGLTFTHLALWTLSSLKPDLLGPALGVYLAFGVQHALLPPLLAKLRPGNTGRTPLLLSAWAAPVAAGLITLPVCLLPETSFLIWPAILFACLIAIGHARSNDSHAALFATMLVTFGAAAIWLYQVPATPDSAITLIGIILFFALLFHSAGLWFAKRDSENQKPRLLSAVSTALPFLLLIMMVRQIPLGDPTPVFASGLFLTLLLLGHGFLTRGGTGGTSGTSAPVAAIAWLALAGSWHAGRFDPQHAVTPLLWYLGFHGLFIGLPFLWQKFRDPQDGPWIASCLSGIGHFLLFRNLIVAAWPNEAMGLLPAALAIPPALSLFAVLRTEHPITKDMYERLAWLGGTTLFFITLIFPLQFDRQWLIVSWALEGASLIWLFRRVPHRGLLWTGLGLLAVCFLRLGMDPAVFTSWPRGGTPVFNWHLYTYGTVAASILLGGWWLRDKPDGIGRLRFSPLLRAAGGALLFLLLNIEIADAFTAPGRRFISFDFGGNFARDMTYTIAWSLFSIALLGLGIRFRTRAARLAAISLLAVALAKLFLHDLAAIGSIYRIAALIATGTIAYLASYLYQKFPRGGDDA